MKIKIRIWDNKKKQMLYDVPFSFLYNPECTKDMIPMLCTPFNDKNKKEIYDKDIVKCEGDMFDGTVVLIVKMHPENYPDSIMLINAENHCRIGDMNMKNVEVIGNIYENKTLVKRDDVI
jgi:hypothetical protein